ncbi:2-oxoacid:ferredoxin oxidoreductase subunit beta [Candidatus Pacearchaeota archaeon]|nr:2-oxoacid:ferredoxin oxidoreductase subunit beta [Candidatus Pacearchaeota archaeon]
MKKQIELGTSKTPTWCPGCFNFQVLAGVKNAISSEIAGGKKEDWAIASGIGCHAKIFDYLNLNGINTLHGRVLPTCMGIKIGNPNLNVIGFSGDGDAYAEGIEHLIHAARYNSDIKYIVHNNRIFALTVGQPTPTTEIGFRDKTNPSGVKLYPLNPIKLMLSLNCGFVARVFADVNQIEEVLEEAFKHKGFAFIEVLQPCLIFHPDLKFKEKIYNLQEKGHNKTNWEEAMKKADEFDYNIIGEKTKIPLGIFYQKERETFENLHPQLAELKNKKIGWRDIKR